ncbi:MAG: hypothetical protein JO115_03500 [Pseudonocardiales bacterium]|nr:hypothetical protein [Pseudonocardiales bacterium]
MAMQTDLRKHPVEDVLSHVETSLHIYLDPQTLVRKRRSLGARTNRGTWVRIEARPLAKIAAQGQAGNGIEAAARLYGIAKPTWFTAVSWHDSPGQTVWRADEVELVTAAPVRSSGSLGSDVELSDEWWETLNASLDNLARQHTTRVATPDTETITQALVTTEINRVFPDQVDATITDHEWVPAHADLNWANLTSPECWILDWEDHGLAPRGLDAATLWISSLTVPTLAERVYRERRTDLETRSGKLMALFHCAKVLNDSGAATGPVFELAAGEAAQLVADLQR